MLGAALRQALTARGARVLQLVRRSPASPAEIQWNPAANPAIPHSAPLDSLAAAIHLSGANLAARRWTPAYKRELTQSRVQSTRALAETLASLPHPPQTLLVASATGFYGNRGDEILDESSAPGAGYLADSCQQWEAAAQPARAAGIRVVHLRLGPVLAPPSRASHSTLAKLVPLFRLCLGGPLGNGRQFFSWITLHDAVAAILFLLESQNPQAATLSGPVNLTAPHPLTNAEFTRALAHALHRPAILPAPAFALRLALGEMADEALLASTRVLPAKLLAAGFEFSHPTLTQALAWALQKPAPPPTR